MLVTLVLKLFSDRLFLPRTPRGNQSPQLLVCVWEDTHLLPQQTLHAHGCPSDSTPWLSTPAPPLLGSPGGWDGKAAAYNTGDPGSVNPWVRKISWRSKWQPTPVFLPGKSQGQRSLVGYTSWGRIESDTTEQFHFLPLPTWQSWHIT